MLGFAAIPLPAVAVFAVAVPKTRSTLAGILGLGVQHQPPQNPGIANSPRIWTAAAWPVSVIAR